MNLSILSKFKYALGWLALTLFTFAASAQKAVEINEQAVGNWFERNWMWVAGGAILLIIIFALSSSSSKARKKITTVVKDDLGNVKTITTTETVS